MTVSSAMVIQLTASLDLQQQVLPLLLLRYYAARTILSKHISLRCVIVAPEIALMAICIFISGCSMLDD